MSKTILIVDDEPEIVELLRIFLEREQIEIIEAFNGAEAWQQMEKNTIDLAVIDIMMPQLDGYQLLKKIREKYKLPVIILSAKNQDSDKILGLGLGADDFVAKPFNPLEVVARIQAQLRRSYEFTPPITSDPKSNQQTSLGDLVLDHHSCELQKRGISIALSSTEYLLLKLFMEAPGRIFTKKQIFENVWSQPYMNDDNTIMVHISRLREKIEDDPRQPVYLQTIRGLGYKFAKRVASI
ncbi:response regulator transcription factor [Paenibacillus wynnii]|uniref:response regulator transcription factor n=1 Tax=Paenibacillus wynnii TaxID=268407 RepID=UPI002792F1FF|nr:response regulator transcription factor [Paenibacillus wynnii]MDQ0193626.1 DNA-binding response OmpR family regulator [Paenibacillus wynnii]